MFVKMNYDERREYFAGRFNEDAGIYIMRLIDIILDLKENTPDAEWYSYYEACRDAGMCNSEALDFLDAYGHDEAWIEEDDDLYDDWLESQKEDL